MLSTTLPKLIAGFVELARVWPESLPLAEVERRAGLEKRFLEGFMHPIRGNALTKGTRGRRGGGQALSRDPAAITLADIAELAVNVNTYMTARHKRSIPRFCALDETAEVIDRAIDRADRARQEALAEISLADLCRRIPWSRTP